MIRIIIWVIMIFGGTALGYYLDTSLFPGIHKNLMYHIVSFIIGLSLLRMVMIISKNTGRILAKYGREGDLPRMETNKIVSEGPYRLMRHPMHFALMFFPLSFAFIVGSPSFIFIIAPAEALFMLAMIAIIEEPEAKRKFGEEYIIYKNNKPWFCIRNECLKELFTNFEKNDNNG